MLWQNNQYIVGATNKNTVWIDLFIDCLEIYLFIYKLQISHQIPFFIYFTNSIN